MVLDREDPIALGALRIALASIFLLSLLSHLGAVDAYFSDRSILAREPARAAFPEPWSVFFWVGAPWAVRAIFGIGVLAHVLWLLGLFTRPAAFVAWFVWVSMIGRHPRLYSMADTWQMVLCTWLMLMPAGRGLSLDHYRGRGGPVPVWCRRIFQLQLAVLYTSTGLHKTGATWGTEGTALYYALSDPYNRHWVMPELLATLQPFVLRPLTWLVRGWEVAFGAFVGLHYCRGLLRGRWRVWDLRPVFLGFGALMHVGIQALLYVVWFSPLTLACYLAFIRPDELRAWLSMRRRC